jgi:hypothetical protein
VEICRERDFELSLPRLAGVELGELAAQGHARRTCQRSLELAEGAVEARW